MLDIRFIRENSEFIIQNCKNRLVKVDINKILELDKKRLELIHETDELRHKQKELARYISGYEKKEEKIQEGKELKLLLFEKEKELENITNAFNEELKKVPNLTHPNAPIGSSEEENREIRRYGDIPNFNFKPKDHVELGESLSLIDFEGGSKVAGQKFYYLKNELVLLEIALIHYAVNLLIKEGFTPFITPDVAKTEIVEGIGFNPRGEETQVYSIANSNLCLIGTAEITLGGLLQNEILNEEVLPLKYVGVSHCFRTEAGTYGKESKGLYRVHQFTKVEMFAFTLPEESEKVHEYLVSLEEKIFQGLKIPYRVVDICTGELGGPAYRKYDLEAWMPGRGGWGEITSASNCTDYQSRRLNIRFRRKGSKKSEFVHMLNGTAIAISRAIIAIMENYQQEDGSIIIPEILQPIIGKSEIRKI